MNLHDEVKRADEASRILGNPVYKEAWASYEAVLLELLANANTPADKVIEVRGWLIAARKARGHLERIVAEGKLAADDIKRQEQQQTIRQRIRSAF
ncbi:MAG: hypothetical protein IPO75_15790 [Betaproteobacteria bacterium]|nr:hypothetical protein [Betaproteobacteria bacterium]